MKKKHLTIYIFFGLLVFSGVNLRSIQLTGENDELTENIISNEVVEIKSIPKSSAYTVRGPIEINGSATGVGANNWTWAKSQGICTGYGNSTHPYIIENYEIDGGGSGGTQGIWIRNSMAYFEIRNCYVYNGVRQAIRLEYTGNGTISNNIITQDYYASESRTIGLYYNCVNNTIFNNTCNLRPISLSYNCDDNIIYQNTIICTDNDGMQMGMGIYLYDNCDNNNITGNYIERHNYYSITQAVFVFGYCHDNIIHRNFFKSKDASRDVAYGLVVADNSNRTEITENYFISFESCIYVLSDSDDTVIQDNILSALVGSYDFISDDCVGTMVSGNYYLPKAPELYVNKVNQTYSETGFHLGLEVVSSQNFPLKIDSIEMWWDGNPVPQNNIIDKGNGFYEVSLSPKLVAPGADPILFSMSICSWTHIDMYCELNIAVDPEAVDKSPPSDDDDKSDTLSIIGGPSMFLIVVISAVASVIIATRLAKVRKLSRS